MTARPALKGGLKGGLKLATERPGPIRSPSTNAFPFASCSTLIYSPHVHFPPTPSLTSTTSAYSPGTYDRAPIAVSPNSCALPERGGRVYLPSNLQGSYGSSVIKGSYFHPRAFEACTPEPLDLPVDKASSSFDLLPPNPRIPDLTFSSSESEDSDECGSPPVVVSSNPISIHHFMPPNSASFTALSRSNSLEKIDNALSFLPYPSSAKDRDLPRRRNSSRTRVGQGNIRRTKSVGAFVEPPLDGGCLGGF